MCAAMKPIGLLLLILSFAVCGQQDFDAFNQQLEKTESNQEKTQLFAQTFPNINQWTVVDQGRFYYSHGIHKETVDRDIEAARKEFSTSISLFESHGQANEYWVKSLLDRSYMDYLLTNDPEQYCDDRKAAVELARQIDHPLALVGSLNQYAFCFNKGFAQFEAGLAVLKEAADVANEHSLSATQSALIHNATGLLYRRNFLHEKAYEYLLKAYQGWAEAGDVQDMFNMQHSLVGESIALQSWTQAQSHVDQLYQLSQDQPDFKDFTFFAHFNQGRLLYAQGMLEQASSVMDKALALQSTTSEQYFINMAMAVKSLAMHRAGLPDATGHLSEDVDALIEQLNDPYKTDLQAVVLWERGKEEKAMQSLWQSKAAAGKSKLEFMKNNTAAISMAFNQEIDEFQKQALEDQLAIKELELENEKSKEKFTDLTRTIAILSALLLLIIVFFLYKSRKEYRSRSRTDFLTGLMNRRASIHAIEDLIKSGQPGKKMFGLAIFDIDDFKKVNDVYGHITGDRVIKNVTAAAQSKTSKDMILGRIGGEEFVLVAPHLDQVAFKQLAESIRMAVANSPVEVDEVALYHTISLGMTMFQPDQDSQVESLLKRADEALYQAKTSGKNQSRYHMG